MSFRVCVARSGNNCRPRARQEPVGGRTVDGMMGRAQSWAWNISQGSKRSGERRDGDDATGGEERGEDDPLACARRRDVAEASGRPPSPIPTCFLLHGRLFLPASPTPPSPQRGRLPPPAPRAFRRAPRAHLTLPFPTTLMIFGSVLPGTSGSQSSCQALHVPSCKFVCSQVPNTEKLALPPAAAAAEAPAPRVSNGFTGGISSVLSPGK